MPVDVYLHLWDLHQRGVIGFAAESINKGRLLLSLHELRRVMAASFGGKNASGQAATLFELMPELKRFFDPEYVDEEKAQEDSPDGDAAKRAKLNSIFGAKPEGK